MKNNTPILHLYINYTVACRTWKRFKVYINQKIIECIFDAF